MATLRTRNRKLCEICEQAFVLVDGLLPLHQAKDKKFCSGSGQEPMPLCPCCLDEGFMLVPRETSEGGIVTEWGTMPCPECSPVGE